MVDEVSGENEKGSQRRNKGVTYVTGSSKSQDRFQPLGFEKQIEGAVSR